MEREGRRWIDGKGSEGVREGEGEEQMGVVTLKVSSTSCTLSLAGSPGGRRGRLEASSPSIHSHLFSSSHERKEPSPR